MFGAVFNYSEPSSGKRHESVFEPFYRPRLTQSTDLDPDVEVSIHPTYATRAYNPTLLSMRMRIIFLMPEQAPAQSCLPNGALVSLVEVASLQSADANRAVWP